MNRLTLVLVFGIAFSISAFATTVANSPAQTLHTISAVAILPQAASCCGGDPGGGSWPFAPTKSVQEVSPIAMSQAASCCGGDPGGGSWPFAPAPIASLNKLL